jgi:hypothetical protein
MNINNIKPGQRWKYRSINNTDKTYYTYYTLVEIVSHYDNYSFRCKNLFHNGTVYLNPPHAIWNFSDCYDKCWEYLKGQDKSNEF